jgi:hypothetical protein
MKPEKDEWTESDRSAWFTFCYSHPTLAQSLVNVNTDAGGHRKWSIVVGTRPPTFVHQRPGETRTELQRRVMSMYPIHTPTQRENQTDGTNRTHERR